jgi:hypothetical protein
MLLKKFKSIENTLFFKEKLWVFESNQLKLDIIREIHDQSSIKHFEMRRICAHINKWYYWFILRQSVERYVKNCHVCKRSKTTRDKYSELLNSLSISDRSWTNVIMNFVIELLESKDFNAILMIIDKLIKMHHYISCLVEENEIIAKKTARLLINHVWKLHELSSIIIFDRESQFVSIVWKTICRLLHISRKLFTAFHSETDEQSEIVNQEIKRYLRSYCNYQQDDWSKWLLMIEFAFNVATSTFTKLFAFMTNYEFESRMNFDSRDENDSQERLSAKERLLTQKTISIKNKMKNIWNFIKKKLTKAQDAQKRYADQKRTFSLEYKLEDIIWLSIKNIRIERFTKKLNHKWIKSYKIKKILRDVCQLNLSSSMKIHDTFHTFLVRFTATDSLIEQIQLSSFSIVINDEEEYEMNDILNSRYHYEKLQYRIAWTDHSSNRAWYFAKNFHDYWKEILDDYHRKYSNKSESKLRLIASIISMIDHFYWLQQAKNLVKDILNKMQAKMKKMIEKDLAKILSQLTF